MANVPDIAFEQRVARFSGRIGLGIVISGLLVLCGWAFDIPLLKSLLPGLADMKANAAAAFVLGGASLWWSGPPAAATAPRPAVWAARLLAAIVGGLGLLTLGEYAFGWDLGIDQLLFDDAGLSPGAPFPGRMALMTAVNFTLLAAALLLIDIETRGRICVAGIRPRLSGYLHPDIDAANEVIGVYGLINDITEHKDVENKLRQLAQFDSLTGLANRSRFNDKLAEAIERSGTSLALMFLDLDDFKSINDTFGHQGGDLALQEFAKRLSRSVRTSDTVARLAGDEFVVIIELLKHADEAVIVAAKIATAMKAPFLIFDQPHVFSASMGIAVRRRGETDGEALLRRADTALYQAKASGRGRYIVEE